MLINYPRSLNIRKKNLESVKSQLDVLKKSAAKTLDRNKRQIEAQKDAIKDANNHALAKAHEVNDLKNKCDAYAAEYERIYKICSNIYGHVAFLV